MAKKQQHTEPQHMWFTDPTNPNRRILNTKHGRFICTRQHDRMPVTALYQGRLLARCATFTDAMAIATREWALIDAAHKLSQQPHPDTGKNVEASTSVPSAQ